MRGDTLVVDNARIHKARDIVPTLRAALAAAGVRMLFLPTYSPELNPCELIFAQVCQSVSHVPCAHGDVVPLSGEVVPATSARNRAVPS